MRELESEIVIDATPDTVWSVLTDFARYPEWNPFVRSIQGEAREGERIRVTIGLQGRRPMTFRPRLLVVEPGRELRWLGRVALPGVFDGEHSFHLEPLPGGRTRVTQRERFRGLLVPLMGRRMYAETQKGFDALMLALKARVERKPH